MNISYIFPHRVHTVCTANGQKSADLQYKVMKQTKSAKIQFTSFLPPRVSSLRKKLSLISIVVKRTAAASTERKRERERERERESERKREEKEKERKDARRGAVIGRENGNLAKKNRSGS